jgi:hypothetical protein
MKFPGLMIDCPAAAASSGAVPASVAISVLTRTASANRPSRLKP